MIGNVAIRSALDNVEFGARGASARCRAGNRWLLEAISCSKNAAQPQNQKDGDSGKDKKLDQR